MEPALRELDAARRHTDALPMGPVRAALQTALRAQETAALPAGPAGTALRLALRCASDAQLAQLTATPHHVAALLLHALLGAQGCVCLGAEPPAAASAGPTAGFAPAERALPDDAPLPDGWVAPDGTAFAFYYRPPSPAGGSARLAVAAIAVGPLLAVHARLTGGDPGAPHAAVELDTGRLVGGGGHSGAVAADSPRLAALLALAAALEPLSADAALGRALEAQVADGLLGPLLQPHRQAAGAAQASSSSSSSSSSSLRAPPPVPARPPAPHPRRPGFNDDEDADWRGDDDGRLFGLPAHPPAGWRPGDFDRDLFPDVGGGGGGPGWLGGGGGGGRGWGGGGMPGGLVGPNHPLFGGGGSGGFGGQPPLSHPPGARFDPLVPPGVGGPRGGIPGPRAPRGGRGGHRGGGGLGGEPPPDHLRPPHEGDDAPPDIYW